MIRPFAPSHAQRGGTVGTKEYERFPETPPFKEIVGRIGTGAGFAGAVGVSPGSLAEIADATLDASLDGLERAKNDEGLGYAFYLLAQITQAARQDDLLKSLSILGLPSPKAVGAIPTSDATSSDYDL